VITVGDIGKTKKKVELEPLGEPGVIEEPVTTPAIPAPEPAAAPVTEPEKVPA
jgi:hypothetical protein